MISFKYLKHNKKQTIAMLVGTILASILLFSISILFSSFRNFMIEDVKKNIGTYHVKIVGNITKNKTILNIKKENEYYIQFKDIKKVYENTENICKKNKCEKITYNSKLLSLYGVNNDENLLNTLKKIIITLVLILSISVFFIIYNSFNISILKQQKDIFLLKISGASNIDLYKIYFLQGIIVGLAGIIIGFLMCIILNCILIKVINVLLCEFFKEKLKFSIYISFIIIPTFFMFLIIIISSIMPLKNIKKTIIYHTNENIEGYNLKKNYILSYSLINYKRERKKYKSLIICIFVLFFLFNTTISFAKYTIKIIDDYIMIPQYDLALISEEEKQIKNISKKFNPKKIIIYSSCAATIKINKQNYNKNYQNATITNLGNNEIVNKVSQVITENEIMKKEDYIPFKNLKQITINEKTLNIKLTNKIPYGFKTNLKSDNVILNLDEENFLTFCPNHITTAFLETNKQKLDNIINEYAKKHDISLSYSNVKKSKQFIKNFILLIKIFVFLIIMIIIFICITTILNIVSASIKFRKKELASLKSFGLANKKISEILCLESLIITIKSFIYALPFILLVFKFLYENLGKIFNVKMPIFDYKILLISLLICFIIVTLCMILSHHSLKKESLIVNIKSDIF